MGIRSSSVSHPGKKRHRVTGISMSMSGEGGSSDGIDLRNPKRSGLKVVGSNSGSVVDRREGEQGTDVEES